MRRIHRFKMHLGYVLYKQSHCFDIFPPLYLMEYLTCGVNESERGVGGRAVMTMGNRGVWEIGPLQEPDQARRMVPAGDPSLAAL